MLLVYLSKFDPVAQLVEHLTFNQVVVSSNLTRITIFLSMHHQQLTILQKYLPQKRIDHSMRVAEMGVLLARKHGANVDLIEVAGLFHDIAKYQTPDTIKARGVQNPKYDSWSEYPKVWHALVGPELLAIEYPNDHQWCYNAMMYHTTGTHNMELEAAILYVSDFIEPHRDHPHRSKIESVALNDLNAAVAWVTHCSMVKLKTENKSVHPWTIHCWNFYSRFMPSHLTLSDQ